MMRLTTMLKLCQKTRHFPGAHGAHKRSANPIFGEPLPQTVLCYHGEHVPLQHSLHRSARPHSWGHVLHLRVLWPLLLIGLVALNLVCLLFVPITKRYRCLFVPIAKHYRRRAEGRLRRHLSRPRLEDESRKAS